MLGVFDSNGKFVKMQFTTVKHLTLQVIQQTGYEKWERKIEKQGMRQKKNVRSM